MRSSLRRSYVGRSTNAPRGRRWPSWRDGSMGWSRRASCETLGFVADHDRATGRRSGRLHRLHRGVYAVGHEALSWDGRCLAAVLANEPGRRQPHDRGVDPRPAPLPAREPSTSPPRPGDAARATSSSTSHGSSPRTVTTVDGIPVTSPARTVLDLAAKESRQKSTGCWSGRTSGGCSTGAASKRWLARAGGHPGRARFATALARLQAGDRRRSAPTSRSASAVSSSRAGLPTSPDERRGRGL